MSWPDGERYLFPQQSPYSSLVVSLLLSLVSTILFSWTGGILSHLNSLKHRFPRFPPRNLCFYVMLAVPSLLPSLQRTQSSVKLFLIFLESAESKIHLAAPADARPKTPLISFCIVRLRTLCVTRCLGIFSLSTTFGPFPGKLPGFWGSMVFRHQPIPRKGSGNNNNNSKTEITDGLLRNKES